ncbi:hypothetical protein ACVWW1_008614 [Bradyrhizobium sp. JR3.5]
MLSRGHSAREDDELNGRPLDAVAFGVMTIPLAHNWLQKNATG